jgi:hypothetical protein
VKIWFGRVSWPPRQISSIRVLTDAPTEIHSPLISLKRSWYLVEPGNSHRDLEDTWLKCRMCGHIGAELPFCFTSIANISYCQIHPLAGGRSLKFKVTVKFILVWGEEDLAHVTVPQAYCLDTGLWIIAYD